MENMNIFDFLYDDFKIKKPLRLIELFAGYGSQALALEYLHKDFESHFVCEFDKYAIQTYNEIHGTNFETSDVTKISAKDLNIVDTDKYDYMMTYSFPCQDLSLAGNRKGMDKGSGTRSGLLWEVERLLRECKELNNKLPNILVMENVPQVLSANGWREWNFFLESLGYKNYCQLLNAKDYGIPQNRERCFMVSILGDYNYTFPEKQKLKLRLKDMLETEVDEKYYLSDKMINYITANNDKWTGNNEKSIINKKIASTINTQEGQRRCDSSNYVSLELEEEHDLKTDRIIEETNLFDLGVKQYNRRTGSVVNTKGISSTLLARVQGDNNLIINEDSASTPKNAEKGLNNERLKETLEKNDVEPNDYIDAYNKNVRKDGISGTITTGVDFRNHYFVAVSKDNNMKIDVCNELIKNGKVRENDVIRHNYTSSKSNNDKVIAGNNEVPTLDTRPDCLGVVVKETEEIQYSQYSLEKIKCNLAKNDVVGTITANAMQSINHNNCHLVKNNLRIRKLTPRECFRLMGVNDREIDKITCSNAQKYKQAGNSIVVNVLMAIFKQLY